MGRAVFCDCLPWLALLLVSGVSLWLIVRLNEGRLDLRRLLSLHGNDVGSAQSLSFVLTLPFFVVILLFIVQVSQLMIGTMVVHYAAFATARAAIVWIPAGLGSRDSWSEAPNCVEGYELDATNPTQSPFDPNLLQPTTGGLTYKLIPGGPKFAKIVSAAWMACLPISPSRNLGLDLTPEGNLALANLQAAYRTLARTSPADTRWRNKLAYAVRYTWVEVRFYHDNSAAFEPPLVWHGIDNGGRRVLNPIPGDEGSWEYRVLKEVGWQDPITVTVTHDLALLPGPGRILANRVGFIRTNPDRVQQQIEEDTARAARPANVYVYRLTASCTLGNEGEKSVLPYEYQVY